MDACVCMGASVSALHGYNKARGPEAEKKSVAVIGDSTFIHSGITSLIDIAYNRSNSTVIILDNSITGMTGHQQNPTTGYTIKGDPDERGRSRGAVPRGRHFGCTRRRPIRL